VINKHLDGGNKTIAQFIFGNIAAKKIIHQHLKHHDFNFWLKLNPAYFLAARLLKGTERFESFRNRLAERLLEAVKFFRLKQIGAAEGFGGQPFLPPPDRAVCRFRGASALRGCPGMLSCTGPPAA